MAGTRVQVDLFFAGKTPRQVNEAFPQLLPMLKAAKAKASKINEGKANEEMTVAASYHMCFHDEPGNNTPCVEKEI